MCKYQRLSTQTTELFKHWQDYLNKLSSDLGADLVIEKTTHAKERANQRKITVGQIKHILQNHFELEHIQKSTQSGYFKFRIIGNDFDDRKIVVVVIPGEEKKGYKIVSVFYSDK